jgi:hypothetical protein
MDELPRPGTAVHLALGGQTWRTTVAAAGPEGLLLSLGEIAPAELLELESGQRLACRFHEAQALCTFGAVLEGQVRTESGDCLQLALAGPVERRQRRQHVRVSLKVPLQLRLPLRNDALTRARHAQEFILECWVQALAVNLSAGGFRALLTLPRHHSVALHKEGRVRMDFAGLRLRDRGLLFLRRDWSSDQAQIIYMFADLAPDEIDRIESYSLDWLHAAGAERGEER